MINKNRRTWVPVIIDFSESCLITQSKRRKYKSLHKHIEPSVLRREVRHTVYSDLYRFFVTVKTVLEATNATDKKLKLINVWFETNYHFKFTNIKTLLI